MAKVPPRLGANGRARVVFRELAAAGETQLWETERARQPDLNRLHLRSLEAILSPTCSADSIINAVAYGATSQGLRVTQRDEGHVVAQRVEAPYLASFSSGRRRSSSGAEREEWRVFVATLGVSKGTAATGGVDRVLLLSFMTDPCVKQTDFAAKGAAAVVSLFGSVASAASGLGGGSVSGRDGGSGGGTSGGPAAAGSGSGSSSSLSAVAIANLRSRHRADALVEAVLAELDALGCAATVDAGVVPTGDIPPSAAISATMLERISEADDDGGINDNFSSRSSSSSSSSCYSSSSAAADGDDAADADVNAVVELETTSPGAEEVVLAPFEGGGKNLIIAGASAASILSVPTAVEGGGGGGRVNARLQPTRQAGGGGDGGEKLVREKANMVFVADGSDDGDGDGDGGDASYVEVRLCLQFVEGLCARAEEHSRRDASETWSPLEETVHRLESDNAKLAWLMEPKYRAAGVEPPRKPTWSGRLPFGNPSGSRAGLEVAKSDGLGDSRRVSLLLQSTPFFVVEGLGVKARVVVASAGMRDGMEGDGGGADSAPGASPSVSNVQQQQQQQPPSPSSSKKLQAPLAAAAAAAAVLGAKRHALVERAVVRALAEVVHDECESREEEVLKAHLPEAQAYVVELEGYMSAIVRREALKAVATSPDGGSGPEIDDDLWRLFAVQETRLYSSSAALGKKPGRIYVTFDTLWFHSKVLGFEARHVLPLAGVKSIVLLGTALDLSSSLVISTKRGDELMFVFPGQRTRQLEPLEVLLRQLATIAAGESRNCDA